MPLAVGLGPILCLVIVRAAWGQDLEIGRPAPEFVLTDQAGNAHRLSDYPGKAVLLPGVPASFLIDRKGRLAARELGPRDWNTGEAWAQLEALLK